MFAHLSFQEYLVAKELHGDPTGDRASDALAEYLTGDDRWKEVLYFYVGLSGNPLELKKWVVGCRRHKLAALRRAVTIGSSDRIDLALTERVIDDRANFLFGTIHEAFPEFLADAR